MNNENKPSMLLDKDIPKFEKLKDIISGLMIKNCKGDLNKIDWEMEYLLLFLDDIKNRLTIAPESYKEELSEEDQEEDYYLAKCNKCGWYGSSRFLLGGEPIADTGDYNDVYCPICGNKNI